MDRPPTASAHQSHLYSSQNRQTPGICARFFPFYDVCRKPEEVLGGSPKIRKHGPYLYRDLYGIGRYCLPIFY